MATQGNKEVISCHNHSEYCTPAMEQLVNNIYTSHKDKAGYETSNIISSWMEKDGSDVRCKRNIV